jgi:pyridoxamine 5'-phosphate oxidase
MASLLPAPTDRRHPGRCRPGGFAGPRGRIVFAPELADNHGESGCHNDAAKWASFFSALSMPVRHHEGDRINDDKPLFFLRGLCVLAEEIAGARTMFTSPTRGLTVPEMSMSPTAFRTRAMEQGLSRAGLDPDPIRQFQTWFEDAIATGIPEPNAMSLATVADDGQPWLRTVLLKLYDRQGFVFFTNYESRKSRHIAGNPKVALLFPWVALARQVKIIGSAERIPTAESLKYFATRPRGSQIGAWASPQSQVIGSRSLLEAKVAEMRRRFSKGQIPLPDFWGGFRVVPQRIEYWQGRESRLHDRFAYSLEGEGEWRIERLAP